MIKLKKYGIILLITAFIFSILWGLFVLNGKKTAYADSEENRYAYSYCTVNVTADKNKILKVEENLTVGFIKESNHLERAVRGKMDSRYYANGSMQSGRGFLARITDVYAEVDGVPAEAGFREINGADHHIRITCPDGLFKKWTKENKIYYSVKLCYTYDLSDDVDGKNAFYLSIFEHYYSRWFYVGGDESNVTTVTYNITFPSAPSDKAELVNVGDSTAVTVDGNTVSAVVPFNRVDGYYLSVPFESYVFDTSAEYFPAYWIFAGIIFAIIFGGLVTAFIFRARRPLAPVQFEPPIMNPLHFSAFWHGYARHKDACTLLLQWAQLGCVRIKKDGNRDIILTKRKDLPKGRTHAEYAYFDALFKRGKVYRSKDMRGWKNRYKRYPVRYAASELAEEAGTPVTRAKGVEAAKAGVMFSSLITLVVACAYFIFISSDWGYALLLIFIVVGAASFVRIVPLMGELRLKRERYKVIYHITLLMSSTTILPFAGLTLLVMYYHYMPLYDYIHITLISIAWIIICLYAIPKFIAKRTPEAQETYGQMIGFKKFLTAVKVSEMELMLEKNPDYYLDVLPYCMIMGLSKKLDKKTEFIAAPEWADGFDAATFASSMFGAIKKSVITKKKKERKYGQK